MLRKNNVIIILLLVTFLKGLLWSFFIPLWHFPDEQAHFAHIEYLAEGGKPPIGRGLDLSEEILTAEHILRTKRDGWGNNHFTYNPKFNIEYSNNLDGLREDEIINLPKETRNNFIKREAATYKSAFYQISELIYSLLYNQNLFVRVFSVRIFWLLSLLGIIYLTFLMTKEIFSKQMILQITIPILVSFHPMFTFVSSGITIDNLVNLFFTIIIYFSVLLLTRTQVIHLVFLVLFFLLGIATKNNFLIAFFVILFPFFYIFFQKRKLFFKLIPIFVVFTLIFYLITTFVRNLLKLLFSGKIPFFDFSVLPDLKNYTLWEHFLWTIRHTIAEVIPWYWGSFRWLSLVLPQWVNRILMRILVAAVIGLLIKLIVVVKNREFNKENLLLGFVFYTAFVYFLALFVWDWFFFRSNGYSFGIQGRYYFPVIVPHMILLVVGLKTFFLGIFKLIKKVFKFKKIKINLLLSAFCYMLCCWFVLLNCIAFYWLTSSYYDVSNFGRYIIQASQYKPWFAKGYWLISLLTIYFVSLIVLMTRLFRYITFSKNEKR